MKVKELMTRNVIPAHPEETVETAARKLARYNVGMLPVCDRGGEICGVITDRDLVTRCVASGKAAGATRVREVMTGQVVSVGAELEVSAAAKLMGRKQVRRLPVTENGVLCGMLSLGDLASAEESLMDAGDALSEISGNITGLDK